METSNKKKFQLIITGIVIGILILPLLNKLLFKEIKYVYACRTNVPILECGQYKVDITQDQMDGSYATAMYNSNTLFAPTIFEAITNGSSYEKGCWLGKKHNTNELAYNVCKSSSGDWIILEGPIETVSKSDQ